MRVAARRMGWRLPATLAVLGLGLGGAFYFMTRCGCAEAAMTTQRPEPFDPDRLRAHVVALAGTIGERNVFHPAKLQAAADYISAHWEAQGFTVNRQTYQVAGVDCHNLEVSVAGTTRPDEIIVVGAHYDSVVGSPGANDNATGVAALVELSGRCALWRS